MSSFHMKMKSEKRETSDLKNMSLYVLVNNNL